MITFQYTITDSVGLHMRPAKLICDFQKSVQSKITIEYQDISIPADRPLRLVTAGIIHGCIINITVSGETEWEDAEEFRRLLDRIL